MGASRSISQECSEESIEGKHSPQQLVVSLSRSLQPFGLQYVWQRISCGREDFVQKYCHFRKLLGNNVKAAHKAWRTLRAQGSVHPVIKACALSFSVISIPATTAYFEEHWLDLCHQMDRYTPDHRMVRYTPDHRMVRYMCEYALAWAMWYQDLDTALETVKAGYNDMKLINPENFFLAPYYTVTIGRWIYEAKARNGGMTYNDITEIRKYADETFRLITTLEDKWARIDTFGAKLSALHLLLLVANYCYGHPDDFPEIYEPLCLRIDSLYKEISEEYNELLKHSGIVVYDQAWFHSVSATYHLFACNTVTTQEDKDRLYSFAQRSIAQSARLYDRNGRWWRSLEEAKRGDDPDSIREYAKRRQSAPHI